MICIFTEGEGDGIKSRLPFKFFSTLADSDFKKDYQKCLAVLVLSEHYSNQLYADFKNCKTADK